MVLYTKHAHPTDAWTHVWYDEAAEAEFIRSPYHPDAATIMRLQGHFNPGLSPAEAAQVCFEKSSPRALVRSHRG
jgi:hypothetical protein